MRRGSLSLSVAGPNVWCMGAEATTGVQADKALRKARVTGQAVKIAAVALSTGVLLLLGSALLHGHAPDWVTDPLREMGALLFVTSTLTLVWDLRGRRLLTEEVMASAGLASEIRQAGLLHVTDSYLADVEWSSLLKSAAEVDLFFSYASTWRNTHATDLRSLVARKNTRLRVVLPDPTDPALMKELAGRYDYTKVALVDRVNEAINDFGVMSQAAHESSRVDVRLTRRAPVFSYYRFDRTTISVLYAQVPGRTPVPTFVSEKGGRLSEFFDSQFTTLWESATQVSEHGTLAKAKATRTRRPAKVLVANPAAEEAK